MIDAVPAGAVPLRVPQSCLSDTAPIYQYVNVAKIDRPMIEHPEWAKENDADGGDDANGGDTENGWGGCAELGYSRAVQDRNSATRTPSHERSTENVTTLMRLKM